MRCIENSIKLWKAGYVHEMIGENFFSRLWMSRRSGFRDSAIPRLDKMVGTLPIQRQMSLNTGLQAESWTGSQSSREA